MMKSWCLAILVVMFFSWGAQACPNCHDVVATNSDPKGLPYTFIILSIFIALSYIPIFILFRAAKKYDPKN